MTTFRSTSRRLLAVALATASTVTMAAGLAHSASAANPTNSELGAQGVGDGPVGPTGCRGDCGPFEHPNPNGHPKPRPNPCGGTTGRSCEPHPGCSGGLCTPPPPPLSQRDSQFGTASDQCAAGEAAACDYIAKHPLPVLEGTDTGAGGGFIQMFPTNADGEIDCAQAPEAASCKAERARRASENNINGIDPADFGGAASADNGVDPGLAEFARDNGLDPADFPDFAF